MKTSLLALALLVPSPYTPATRIDMALALAQKAGVEEQYALDFAYELRLISPQADIYAPLTLEQAITILYRFGGSSSSADQSFFFWDQEQISPYAWDAMQWAIRCGKIEYNGWASPKQVVSTRMLADLLNND